MNKDIDKAARDRAIYIERLAKEYVEQLTSNFAESEETIEHVQRVFMAGAKLLQPEIDSLKAEIDELIEALEEAIMWVRVEERTPSNREWVLVAACNFGFIGIAQWYDGRWYGSPDITDAAKSITHWKPYKYAKAAQLLEKYGKK